MAKVFIDGQAGTTGLSIHQRLAHQADIELLAPIHTLRKDLSHRLELMEAADISILCLPDESAQALVTAAPADARILDASSAFRVHTDWVYGLPEMSQEQAALIQSAKCVSNPGCYPTATILMLRPLVEMGLLMPEASTIVIAQSGYSGGGKALIDAYENGDYRNKHPCARPYALDNNHKHLPEMRYYSGLQSLAFLPSVGAYKQGMLVQIPLLAEALDMSSQAATQAVLDCWRQCYDHQPFVQVTEDSRALSDNGYLDPAGLAETDYIELSVFGNQQYLWLTARLDNLGKGAGGAAVQNLNLMLGRSTPAGAY